MTFPSLNIIADLNNIEASSNTQFIFTWKNCDLNSCSNVTTSSLTNADTLDPQSLRGFLRLVLPSLGKKFTVTSLKTEANLTCGDTNAVNCFNDSKIIACKNNFFWSIATDGTQSCAATCTNSWPRYLYTKTNASFQVNKASENTNTGYCNGDCHASTGGKITCPTGITQWSDSNYTGLACNGATYTKFSFFCLQNDLTYMSVANEPLAGAIFYSQGFNSKTIEIGVTNLTEYHFEVWFLPDLIFLPKIVTAIASPKFYVLWTDSIRIKKDTKAFSSSPVTTDYKIYNGSTAGSILPTNSQNIEMKNGQWFKIQYSVIKNGSNWELYFYSKNSSDTGYKKTDFAASPSLSKIAFCTNDCSNYFSDGVWYSGAYKLLKVWDASLMPKNIYLEMDR